MADRFVVAFDIGRLLGLADLDVGQGDALPLCQIVSVELTYSRQLSTLIATCLPRHAIVWFKK